MKFKIEEVTNKQMINWFGEPYYGYASYETKKVYVLNDLNPAVREAVIAHEMRHLRMGDRGDFFKNEIPALWAAFKTNPKGFFIALYKTLTSKKRVKLYISRIKRRK